MQFINAQITAGVWQGDLVGAGSKQPDLHVTHLGQTLDQVTCTRDAKQDVWRVAIPIPSALISDGVQTFVINDDCGSTIGSFAIICGEPLTDDLRAEITLLRSELDLLQKAFRQHCADS
ncbi:hypothetical protein BC777_2650 [Yoonia maricola]|uniref:Uncharacterized protein n=1 Tax=Yoonia maricola TaxID=420999 RepID=A0A2M8W5V6_9RHOB|nr:hypothetical protein [Yoonia maricola]PJI86282.1 hypothetical protein BC777_2650 [Yoonia maricola]